MKKDMKKKLISQFYKRNKFLLCMAALGAVVTAALPLALSWLLQQLLDRASGVPVAYSLFALLQIGIILTLVSFFCLFMNSFVQPRFTNRAMCRYKDFVFREMMQKNEAGYRQFDSHVYLSMLVNDAGNIEEGYIKPVFELLTQSFTFAGAIVMMFLYSPLMTVFSFVLTLLPLLSTLPVGNRLKEAEKAVSEENKSFSGVLLDCLVGFSVIKNFRAEQRITSLFSKRNTGLENKKYRKFHLQLMIDMLGGVTGMIAQLGVFLLGAYLASVKGTMTPGVVLVFVNLMNFTIRPITVIPSILAKRGAAMQLVEKMADCLLAAPSEKVGTEVIQPGCTITCKDLSFSYGEGEPTLDHLSLSIKSGKSYAVIGESGSGKSTLLQLLYGAKRNYTGEILFGEKELRTISQQSLYENISVILQTPFLFADTIRNNVTMYQPVSEERLRQVAQRSQLEGLIAEKGWEYRCSPESLSGGERQRISIARSLLQEADILIGDEITSALDAGTAAEVARTILSLQGVTRIMVTHSLQESILSQYDELIILKNGRVEEQGHFEELMEKKGYFYALFTIAQ